MSNYHHSQSRSGRSFDTREDGLFAVDDCGSESRICDAIWHIGNAEGTDGGDAADIIEFLDCTGAKKELIIPRRDSMDHATRMFERLADYNVPRSKDCRDQIVSYLAECRRAPKRTFLLVQRMGWHGGSFVIGSDVISPDAVDIRLDGPLSQAVKKFGHGGTLTDYQRKVLLRARHSSRLMTGVALALLAPLARLISLENGGINIVGSSGLGKTTMLRVIGSFYGGGSEDYFQTWLMTDNAPATLGYAHCDLPLLLDELDLLDPDPKKAADRSKTIVHRLAVGQGKAKHHYARSEDRGLTDFHVMFASTSEHRLPDFMREGGRNVTGGQVARFVDILADAAKGFKIFERLPKDRKTGKRIDPDRYLQRLNQACRKYYGVAGRAYLRCLVDDSKSDPNALKSFLNKQIAAFETTVANDHGVDPRIRRRFAALYAAGQLGLHYKILPVELNRFMDAIGTCYRASVGSEPGPSSSATQAIGTLGKFLNDNWKRFAKADSEQPLVEEVYAKVVGLRRANNSVWLKTNELHKLFPADWDSAVKLLVGAGVISGSGKGPAARQQRIPGLGKKAYFYTIDRTKLDAARRKTPDY